MEMTPLRKRSLVPTHAVVDLYLVKWVITHIWIAVISIWLNSKKPMSERCVLSSFNQMWRVPFFLHLNLLNVTSADLERFVSFNTFYLINVQLWFILFSECFSCQDYRELQTKITYLENNRPVSTKF